MGYNDLQKKAVALLGILGTTATATIIAMNKNKQKEALKEELQEVRYKISKLKSDLFTSIYRRDEIQRLERKEKEIMKQLNNL